jgi:hypothetical protein
MEPFMKQNCEIDRLALHYSIDEHPLVVLANGGTEVHAVKVRGEFSSTLKLNLPPGEKIKQISQRGYN